MKPGFDPDGPAQEHQDGEAAGGADGGASASGHVSTFRLGAQKLQWRDGNEVALLQNGVEFFPALCQAIDAAREVVHLETYIFELDDTGERVLAHLAAAARRGVRVRVVLDGFGSQPASESVAARVLAAGGQCRIYRPEPKRLARLLPRRQRLRRLHRKMCSVDGRVVFVGGINIIDDFAAGEPGAPRMDAPRFDYAVRLSGPIAADAIRTMDLLWVRLSWAQLRHPRRRWEDIRLRRPGYVSQPQTGPMRAALALRDNLRHRHTIERAYLLGIASAQRDIIIANAYFFPGLRFRKALAQAVRHGVRVRLLLQGKVEYRMQYHATRSLYDELLAAGMEIYEYMPSFLHAKVAVIDDFATVGSSNLDPFSLLLAREANVMVDHAPFAAELRASLERAIDQGGRRIELERHGRRGWLHRLFDAASYVVLRIGVALTGKGQDY